MADRITQLQDSVNVLAEHFCNSVGVLSTQAEVGPEAEAKRKEVAEMFSKLISQTARDVDFLIQALPSAQSTVEIQSETLESLETQNTAAAQQLRDLVQAGEVLGDEVKTALTDLVDHQFELSKLTKDKQPDS
ncbi:mediator of RNA polymerase II transcription subunit 21-like [Sycon ciliatum]|uniref:mediator of RNA polymerase II transcription subunit 21-like n=1 Tax=Sycon ciliatum TaxID=27933 RepID=UPI0020AC3216|eukprot:scpid104604/ scgid21667/ Mediator of RNA polymerase II transcription subunit 21; Mediator complex subunit 21